ncbi:glycoside hydrolase family 3 N-terminal domain-containing protein [Brevundimonas balnearis]|uniref:beta-glucosidase n=1 Tax=Brevundimonas balnearis TaxID=1572858 RepID=A0ABV6R0W0_9CAUL
MPDRPALNLDRRSVLMGASALAIAMTAPPVRASAADEARIEDLIRRMTLEEKAGQLTIMPDLSRAGAFANANPTQLAERAEILDQVRDGEVGGLFNGVGAAGARELQRIAVEESRLKIPLIFGADIIHGYKTVFPIPLGESASFEPELAERTARYAAIEASAAGLHWTFAPMVDVARDQRWGRVAEGAGEDVHLGCVFAAARVKGFQGPDLLADDSMLACPKHFAAYGAVTGGMDYASADIPETTLREVHLPPFVAAFEAGALTVMSAFNDIAGVPASGSRKLMTDMLRGEMGFDGFVVSDYTADMELIAHGYAADAPDATLKALYAGVDMSMASGFYRDHVPDLVRSGRLSEAVVDEAVRRLLRIKAVIGLFDNPYRSLDPAREEAGAAPADIRALGREAGRKSIVMLRNEGDLLPLSKDRRLALIGPFGADEDNLFGPWAWLGGKENVVSLEAGLRAAGATFTTVKGSDVEAPIDGGIEAAVRAAQAADVVLLAVGETQNMSGEAQSRIDIGLPAPQQALAEAVIATGKPVVVLLRHGRALAIEGAVREAQAILATWFLGSETGHSIADILFGEHAPSGRLPVSFPQASGQQPYFYNHRRTGRPQLTPEGAEYKARYREVTHEALYPFGFGLTYTRFEYGPVELSAARMNADGSVTARCRITNVGGREGEEVAQLYVHDRVASLARPVRELKDFRKVRLAPGQSITVEFTIGRDHLAFVNPDLRRVAEPGEFDVWIAPSAVAGEPVTLTLA